MTELTVINTPNRDDEIINIVLKKVESSRRVKLVNNKNVSVDDVINNPSMANSKRLKITHKLLEDAYSKLRILVEGKTLDANSIAIIAAYALQISNEMMNTNKAYKVELTMYILRKLIDEEIISSEQKILLNMAIETIVPSLLNTIDDLPGLLSKLLKKIKKCICKK